MAYVKNRYCTGNPHLFDVNQQRAKEMRENPTEAEAAVWELVRANRLGCKFRRQHPVGQYIVDFICIYPHPKPLSSSEGMCKGLVIEVDGPIHLDPEQVEWDRKRDEWLERNGYKVVRFRNEEVVDEMDSVKAKIVEELNI